MSLRSEKCCRGWPPSNQRSSTRISKRRVREWKRRWRARYLAAFIGHEPGKAVFVGLYKVGATNPLTAKQVLAVPAYKELIKLGMRNFAQEGDQNSVLWFDLALTVGGRYPRIRYCDFSKATPHVR
jgi:hypothetical protein